MTRGGLFTIAEHGEIVEGGCIRRYNGYEVGLRSHCDEAE